ncbi:DUF5916 domain-containing protein [Kangiella sediminilitoris]|uniref:Putative membrane associated hydrolase n=1 Tax=Kangiella sediminilitoris TaxID=1144748 RepID=A0A1B3BA04_9GAMM|nr:carbohydrate binding family 9 domain-containing protein [Kangiella sediminilitoris]AOE49631.1 Putative membrane associated hydrolase [Kangiella sediminilitoris]
MKKQQPIIIAVALALMLVLGYSAHAQDSKISIPKTSGKIDVDGRMDEPFWKDATKVDYRYETQPRINIEPLEKTTAYIIENGDSLLVAIVAYDSDPSQIQASFRKRDRIWGEDSVGFKVDTFNDERKAYNFFVNPYGIQGDSIEDDVLGREDSSWDAIWNSAGRITKDGYVVEFEIPFKVLRFPNTKGKKVWGIDFVRFYPRDYQHRFAYSPNDRNLSCVLCQIGKAEGLENIVSGNNLEITPYTAAQKSERRDPPVQNEWQGDGVEYEAGVDLRWGVTDNSVLGATINPDFSQVETDAAQLDVNKQFSLFYSEKRPFFLEGADYFNTQYTLLHTRNIADPDFGIKYTGKSEGNSYGALISRDQSTSFILPGPQGSSVYTLLDDNGQNVESDVAVARYALDVGENSQVGVMTTHRSAGEYENNVYSVDGVHQLYDAGRLRYQVMYTDSDNTEDMQQNLGMDPSTSGMGYRLNYGHSDKHWNWYLSRTEFDEDFRMDVGYLTIVGNSKDVGGLGYRWYGDDDDFFYEKKVKAEYSVRHFTSNNDKYEQIRELSMDLYGSLRSTINLVGGKRDYFFAQQWFDQDFFSVNGSFRPASEWKLGFNIDVSDDIDYRHIRPGEYFDYGLYTEWQVNDAWFLGADISETDFDVNDGQLFNALIFNLNTNYHFSAKSYLRFIVRYSDVDYNTELYSDPDQVSNLTRTSRQLLYTYKWNPRTAFYIGYSDNGFEDDTVNRFEKTGRSFFTKFSYAFQL